MKIHDVTVVNAPRDSKSAAGFWVGLRSEPERDETIKAVVTLDMSYREYEELLARDALARDRRA